MIILPSLTSNTSSKQIVICDFYRHILIFVIAYTRAHTTQLTIRTHIRFFVVVVFVVDVHWRSNQLIGFCTIVFFRFSSVSGDALDAVHFAFVNVTIFA